MLMSLVLALVSAAVSDPASGTAAPPPAKERLICRRETPIGSLIARRKTCLTKSEWDKRIADGNEEARRQVYDNAGRPACNGSASC